MVRILLTGGGTGGHTYPLLAVAREIKKANLAVELYFFGLTNFGRGELEQEGVRVYRVFTGKLRRHFDLRWPLELVKIPLGFVQALLAVFWIMPDAVLAKGGYGSIPAVLAARLYRIPVVIHESDAVPGLANRLLARFAQRILVAFPEAQNGFRPRERKRILLVGNPSRGTLFTVTPKPARQPTILVLGGSQGAERINDLVLAALPDLLKDYTVLHQTGEKNLERVKRDGERTILKELLAPWQVRAFFNEEGLAVAYANADCIVSRAGAGAIFEIAASGKPSVLIPLNAGSRGEQLKNAYAYAASGAAVVLEEANLTPHLFVKTVRDVMHDPALRTKMQKAAKQFATPDAARKIAEIILNIKN